uniref:Glycogen debranching enzyme n=1 Tax=Globodera pallida TaxID=36090 RepID=A0A183C430_GLOPA
MDVNVAHSDQIYVYLMEPLEADPNNDVDQQQKIVPLFYQVTMRHKCLVFNEVDSTWERWDDDESTHSSLPAEKYYFRRDRFDKGLLLLNSVEKCYVQLQIRPMERRCTEGMLFGNKEGMLFGKQSSSKHRLLVLYRSPPLIWPLKWLSFWKLSALLDQKKAAGFNDAITNNSNALEQQQQQPYPRLDTETQKTRDFSRVETETLVKH